MKNIMKNKKASIMDSTLAKVVLGLIFLVILIGLVLVFSGALDNVWQGLADVFRFGG